MHKITTIFKTFFSNSLQLCKLNKNNDMQNNHNINIQEIQLLIITVVHDIF